jgi:hypothetical protein
MFGCETLGTRGMEKILCQKYFQHGTSENTFAKINYFDFLINRNISVESLFFQRDCFFDVFILVCRDARQCVPATVIADQSLVPQGRHHE